MMYESNGAEKKNEFRLVREALKLTGYQFVFTLGIIIAGSLLESILPILGHLSAMCFIASVFGARYYSYRVDSGRPALLKLHAGKLSLLAALFTCLWQLPFLFMALIALQTEAMTATNNVEYTLAVMALAMVFCFISAFYETRLGIRFGIKWADRKRSRTMPTAKGQYC